MTPSLAIAGRETPWFDDVLLAEELRSRAVEVDLVDWRSTDFEPGRYDSIYVSSTWNLREEPDAFLRWLTKCEEDGRRRLINDARVLRDGVIKSVYLSELAATFGEDDKRSGSITPSRFFSRNGSSEHHTQAAAARAFADIVGELDEQRAWRGRDLVLKPIVSADGHNTFVVARSAPIPAARPEHVLDECGAERVFRSIIQADGGYGAILQSYQAGIERGEYSLVFLRGVFSHAILKPPGFRSSDTSKRRALVRQDLPPGMLSFAQDVVEWALGHYGDGAVTRARIDLIQADRGPVLCEMECVEPNTNLRSFGESAQAMIVAVYADAVQARLGELRQVI
ncbi:ATP-grasp domain-containing protein [Pyruvatibacter mobilis]|uniref:ATP-grasp domain-containing protein n=1 Tax=Pyruvatibacter mobilis TaxID=1712261 RepID=UPI003BAB64C2